MNVNELLEELRELGDGEFTLSISEGVMEKELQSRCSCGRCHQNDFMDDDDDNIFYSAVRMTVEDCAVTVVRDDGLEETLEEAFDRLSCSVEGVEYEEEYDTDTTTKAADVLRATLEELGFDRAVTLLEKLNALSARN